MLLVLDVFRVGLYEVRWSVVLWDEIVLFHQQVKKSALLLVVFFPGLVLNLIFWWLFQGALSVWSQSELLFVVFDEGVTCLKTLDVGVGQFGHDVLLALVDLLILGSFQFRLPTKVLLLAAVTVSQLFPLLFKHIFFVSQCPRTSAQQVFQHYQKVCLFARFVENLGKYLI